VTTSQTARMDTPATGSSSSIRGRERSASTTADIWESQLRFSWDASGSEPILTTNVVSVSRRVETEP
jgi:hypothetical protein